MAEVSVKQVLDRVVRKHQRKTLVESDYPIPPVAKQYFQEMIDGSFIPSHITHHYQNTLITHTVGDVF